MSINKAVCGPSYRSLSLSFPTLVVFLANPKCAIQLSITNLVQPTEDRATTTLLDLSQCFGGPLVQLRIESKLKCPMYYHNTTSVEFLNIRGIPNALGGSFFYSNSRRTFISDQPYVQKKRKKQKTYPRLST